MLKYQSSYIILITGVLGISSGIFVSQTIHHFFQTQSQTTKFNPVWIKKASLISIAIGLFTGFVTYTVDLFYLHYLESFSRSSIFAVSFIFGVLSGINTADEI